MKKYILMAVLISSNYASALSCYAYISNDDDLNSFSEEIEIKSSELVESSGNKKVEGSAVLREYYFTVSSGEDYLIMKSYNKGKLVLTSSVPALSKNKDTSATSKDGKVNVEVQCFGK